MLMTRLSTIARGSRNGGCAGEVRPPGDCRMKQLSAILLGLALVGCSTVPTFVSHDIPSFRPVPDHPGVYRGGQPKSPAGWAYLQSLGVSNIVKLNVESEASDGDARALGMTVNYFPIPTLHQLLLKPDRQAVSTAVTAITPGTYVHCKQGQDRTGLIVGCKRVWQDGWAKTNAVRDVVCA